MPKKKKEFDDYLKTIEFLLAGILLKKESNVKQIAKIIGCSDKVLTKLYPEKKLKRKKL